MSMAVFRRACGNMACSAYGKPKESVPKGWRSRCLACGRMMRAVPCLCAICAGGQAQGGLTQAEQDFIEWLGSPNDWPRRNAKARR